MAYLESYSIFIYTYIAKQSTGKIKTFFFLFPVPGRIYAV